MTDIDADAAMACGDRIVLILLLPLDWCCCRNVEVVSGVREETPGIANSRDDDDVECSYLGSADGLTNAIVL